MEYTYAQLDAWMSNLAACTNATGKVGFAIARNYRRIRDAIQEYIDKKDEIIVKYGEMQSNGSYIITDADKLKDAEAELNEYSSIKVECDFVKIPDEAFENTDLTAAQMLALEFMMEDTTPVKETSNEPTKPVENADLLKPIDPDRF